MVIESSLDLMMTLLYTAGATGKKCEPVRDTMRLVKLLFLLVKEGGFQKFEKEFGFEGYDYGPWGGQIYDNIEVLKQVNLITATEDNPKSLEEGIADNQLILQLEGISFSQNTVSIYRLTNNGTKVGKKLYDDLSTNELKNIQNIKMKFNRMQLSDLVKYVYSKYTKYTLKSKIKKKVLASSMFGTIPNLAQFKREEEDFRD